MSEQTTNIEPRILADIHIAKIEQENDRRRAELRHVQQDLENGTMSTRSGTIYGTIDELAKKEREEIAGTIKLLIAQDEALVAYLRKLMALDTDGVDLIPECDEYAAFYESERSETVLVFFKGEDPKKRSPVAVFKYDRSLPGFEPMSGEISDAETFMLNEMLDATRAADPN